VSFHDELGVRRLINASTTFTVLGGSLMPPIVLDAMREAAGAFVDMHELHEAAGAELARLTHNEAAYVTSGCAAGMVLAVLGCRTRGDLRRIAGLPDDPLLPDEVVMHTAHRIPYDSAVRLAGARIRQIGNVLQTFDWELESAITDRTAAVLYVVGSHMPPAALPLPDVVRIAHERGVPVIVDAAAQLPPVENLWRFTGDVGADFALFSGGKALRGPQASGLMVGRAELVAAARANGSPHQRLARAMKAGKEEIAGLVAAVRRYVALDHAAQAQEWYAICQRWASALAEAPGVRTIVEDHNEAGQPVPRVRVEVDQPVGAIVEALRKGEPGIVVLPGLGDCFYLGPDLLEPGEPELVLDRVATELRAV
jgi:L-seryl-tRNA(Ser) seleniumtransferase